MSGCYASNSLKIDFRLKFVLKLNSIFIELNRGINYQEVIKLDTDKLRIIFSLYRVEERKGNFADLNKNFCYPLSYLVWLYTASESSRPDDSSWNIGRRWHTSFPFRDFLESSTKIIQILYVLVSRAECQLRVSSLCVCSYPNYVKSESESFTNRMKEKLWSAIWTKA